MKDGKSVSFASNVIILLAAQLAVKVLGMLYRMVITNMDGFGDLGNGYYAAGFQIYTFLLALSSVGIPNAISKLVSERTAEGDEIGAKMICKTALILFSLIGAALSIGLFWLSEPIAKVLLHMEGAKYTLSALSPSIFFVCVSSVLRGYFSGINKMQIMSISQVVEQAFKSVLTVLFVVMAAGSEPEMMSAYANLATTAATVLGALYLCYAYHRCLRVRPFIGRTAASSSHADIAGRILAIAVPISLCSVISAINRIVDTATVTRGIETAFRDFIPPHPGAAAILQPTAEQLGAEAVRLSGMLSKCDTLLNLPLALNIALATVLVPSIAKCNAEGNRRMIQKYVHASLLVSVVLILPCAAGYAILAEPIYRMIYPNAPLGFELLQISTIGLLFTAMNQTITGALQGIGRVHVPAFALAAGCVVKLLANLLLIQLPSVNIYGAPIGSALCQGTVFAIEFFCLSREAADLDVRKGLAAKPLLCCLAMSVVTCAAYGGISRLSASAPAAVIGSAALSALVYGGCVIRLRVFSDEELAGIPLLRNFCRKFSKKPIRKKSDVVK